MKLSQAKPKLIILISFLGFVIIVLTALVISSFFKPGKEEKPRPSPSGFSLENIAPNTIEQAKIKPESLPTNVKEIREKIIAAQIANNKGDLLLSQTQQYKIEYITTPDVFFVAILKDPAETAKIEAERWFLRFGLKQTDLCDLPVRFVLDNYEIRKTNPNFSSLPNGCTK